MKKYIVFLSWVLALGILTPSVATSAEEGAPTVTDAEQQLLEESLKDDSQASSKASPSKVRATNSSMNPSIAFIADFSAAWFSIEEPLQLGAHDPEESGLHLQQLELFAHSKVDHYFNFQMNVVFAHGEAEIEELFIQTLSLPASLQMRFGKFLLPYGRINTKHPHTWRFIDQTLMIGKFMGEEGGRGLGVETSWLSPLPWFAQLTLSVNQPDGDCCTRSFFDASAAPIKSVDDFIYTGRLEQFWELNSDWSLLVGASTVVGENKTGNNRRTQLTGGDVLLRYKPTNSPNRRAFTLQAEWTHRTRQMPEDELEDHGGYIEAIARLSPEWEMGARWEQVEGLENDPLNPDWTDYRMRTAGQITWYPSHFSRMRLQVNHDNPSWMDEPLWAVILGVEVLVGAHGGHQY